MDRRLHHRRNPVPREELERVSRRAPAGVAALAMSGPQAALHGLQRSVGNQAVLRLQRQMAHGANTQFQDRNLADAILSGGANGITPPVLNAKEIPILRGAKEAAAKAIKRPTIDTTRSGWFSGDYTARVTAVPTNTVGANVYIPHDPPWVSPTAEPSRVGMIGLGGGFAGTDLGPGNCDMLDARRGTTKFTARGDASDATFLEAIRQHELHHAEDHWRAAQAVLGPWDRDLQDQLASKRSHTAPTEAEAIAAVYADAGGTPDQVAEKLDTLWVQLDADFHATAEGRRSVLKKFSVSADGADATGWYDY